MGISEYSVCLLGSRHKCEQQIFVVFMQCKYKHMDTEMFVGVLKGPISHKIKKNPTTT